jgi:hypothetical protein
LDVQQVISGILPDNGYKKGRIIWPDIRCTPTVHCTVGWVDIGTGTKVPLRFVTYLSKVTKINEKSVLTQ